MQPVSADFALRVLACRRGHVGDWLFSPSSGWRVCRACRREDRRRLALAHGSICQAFGNRRGRRKPTSPHARHLATIRKRTSRAKLASGRQAHAPHD